MVSEPMGDHREGGHRGTLRPLTSEVFNILCFVTGW